jgi:L(+)-tartrate dehydratase alpha subunit
MMNKTEKFLDTTVKFINLVAKVLPDDVVERLKLLREKETVTMSKAIYDSMFENLEKAVSLDRPICQDTGVIQFFVRVGTKFPLIDEIGDLLYKATLEATEKVPLRHNAVETFIERNTGTNTGKKVPYIDYEILPNSSNLEMDVYMAGGGCSLPGRSTVMMPSAGYEGIAGFVAETMVNWGINACPPLVVGVGIGTCVASAAKLAKKASLRRVGSRNPEPKAAEMEEALEKALGNIGIGAQGLPGKSGVLCVNIENMARHPSALGAAVSFGCWAHRRGTISFDKNMNYTLLDHKGVTL